MNRARGTDRLSFLEGTAFHALQGIAQKCPTFRAKTFFRLMMCPAVNFRHFPDRQLFSLQAPVSFFHKSAFLVTTSLFCFHPESFGRGWAGTSPKPLVIGRHPRDGSVSLLDSGAFLAVVIVP
jgi:hypothetical protein